MFEEKKLPWSYLLVLSMRERLTEDQRKILNTGNELDPGIRQTPLTSGYRGQGKIFRILRYVFTSIRAEMCGEAIVR